MINRLFRIILPLLLLPCTGTAAVRDSISIDSKQIIADYLNTLLVDTTNKKQVKRFGRKIRRRIFAYSDSVMKSAPDTFRTDNYTKVNLNLERRNVMLWTIPRLIEALRTDDRKYLFESYGDMETTRKFKHSENRKLFVGTTRHNRRAMEHIRHLQNPTIYRVTLYDDYILSPFNRQNRRFYSYKYVLENATQSRVLFEPRLVNTQLVSGMALVDNHTGRILNYSIKGFYDMTSFKMDVEQGEEGFASLLPKSCDIQAKVHYFGNKIQVNMTSVNDVNATLPDTIKDEESVQLMTQLRPIPLTDDDQAIVDAFEHRQHAKDSIQSTDTIAKPSFWKKTGDFLWNAIGRRMWHTTNTDLGNNQQGYIRVGPLFNPLYFGYAGHRGLVYKMRLNLDYNFTPNSCLDVGFKGGYSFKQRMFYFEVPVTYYFNKRKEAFVRFEISNGNRITNSSVLQKVKDEYNKDSKKEINFDEMGLDYFKDMSMRLMGHYEFNDYIGMHLGMVFHRRSAVSPYNFHQLGQQTVYKTVAPLFQFQYRPIGKKGPFLTAAYEVGLKGALGGDMAYNRWEFDGSYILRLPCTRSWSLRAGFGFYSSKGDNLYFLDYLNFHANYLPGGWNDEWSGEFELLNSDWYNASDYYIRANSTYESPLMLLSWLPYVGRIVQKERLYLSALAIRHYSPYIECGYGFTNSVFSMGIFTGFSPRRFEGIGFKFGLELFENW